MTRRQGATASASARGARRIQVPVIQSTASVSAAAEAQRDPDDAGGRAAACSGRRRSAPSARAPTTPTCTITEVTRRRDPGAGAEPPGDRRGDQHRKQEQRAQRIGTAPARLRARISDGSDVGRESRNSFSGEPASTASLAAALAASVPSRIAPTISDSTARLAVEVGRGDDRRRTTARTGPRRRPRSPARPATAAPGSAPTGARGAASAAHCAADESAGRSSGARGAATEMAPRPHSDAAGPPVTPRCALRDPQEEVLEAGLGRGGVARAQLGGRAHRLQHAARG